MEMGDRIYSRRKELGMTMEELGDKIGVQKSAVNKWEKGIVSDIKRSTIKAIAEALDCSPIWLMGMTEDIHFSPESAGTSDGELLVKIHKLTPANRAIIESTVDAMLSTQ